MRALLILPFLLLEPSAALPAGSPEEPIRFPADAAVADITKPPYNAVPDGKTDCTASIQQALNDRKKLIYFPNGTYLVSDTLRWAINSKNTSNRQIFQGESQEGSIIQLADSAPSFQDPANPKEVIWTGKFPPQSFRNGLRNLTVNTGRGNAGAIGVRYYANNQGGMHYVTIRSGDGLGKIGLDLGYTGDQGPCLIRKVRILGFDTGISLAYGSSSVVMEDVQLEGQKEVGISNSDQPLSIRKLSSKNSVTAIRNSGNTLLTLIDSTFIGEGDAKNRPAIQNQTGLFVRNLVTEGYASAIDGKQGIVPGPRVDEWTSHPPISLFPSPSTSLNLPIKETPEMEWGDLAKWKSAIAAGPRESEVDIQGRPETIKNYASSFQEAIDSGAEVIYFPVGNYAINGDIYIRKNVKRIIGLESSLAGERSAGTWYVEDGTSPVLRIERIEAFYTNINMDIRTNRTVVLSSFGGGKGIITLEKNAGDVFVEDVAHGSWELLGGNLWARQIDAEGGYGKLPEVARGTFTHGYDKILNNGATLWILGIKSEGDGTHITALNHARTEVLGGFIYANKAYRPQKQWFVNVDSSLSFSLVERVIRKQPFEPVLETRNGVTRLLEKGKAPDSGGGSLVVMFTGYSR